MNQVETAAHRRQQILDFLRANPGANMGAIGAHLFGDDAPRSRHHNTVHTMIEWGELRFEGKARNRKYWALVETTRPVLEVQQARETGIRKKNAELEVAAILRTARGNGSSYIHRSGDRPIPNQGGQGAGNRAWGIQSSFSVV